MLHSHCPKHCHILTLLKPQTAANPENYCFLDHHNITFQDGPAAVLAQALQSQPLDVHPLRISVIVSTPHKALEWEQV